MILCVDPLTIRIEERGKRREEEGERKKRRGRERGGGGERHQLPLTCAHMILPHSRQLLTRSCFCPRQWQGWRPGILTMNLSCPLEPRRGTYLVLDWAEGGRGCNPGGGARTGAPWGNDDGRIMSYARSCDRTHLFLFCCRLLLKQYHLIIVKSPQRYHDVIVNGPPPH